MAEHKASIRWDRDASDFLKGRFSREHTWAFDGGAVVPASASPAVVPPPHSNPAAIDPEEAFVASIASCHMLTFLYLASRQGFQIETYEDEAVGMTTRDAQGKTWVSRVTLHPKISFNQVTEPSAEAIARMHHGAHDQCFIANSVKTTITVE